MIVSGLGLWCFALRSVGFGMVDNKMMAIGYQAF